MMEREIGRGCFGTCYLAKFGARTVVVIQQQNCQARRQEARMTARLGHPNTACFIGIVERQNRVDIVSTFYNINGERSKQSCSCKYTKSQCPRHEKAYRGENILFHRRKNQIKNV